ncbi:MAG: helix-turn-helix domain-containing protein [Kiloniellaceae bacterium]
MESTLARLIATIGESRARLLAVRYGKTSLHLPARMPADHALARLIGFEAACALVRAFGTGRLYIPSPTADTAERARLVRELTDAGHSAPAIARRLGVSERTVHRLRARRRAG